jgi:hypothetical protein
MPNNLENVAVLLRWCADNSIVTDERIRISIDNQTGIVVRSEDDYIHPQTTRTYAINTSTFTHSSLTRQCLFELDRSVVKIPKTAVISVRSCSLAGAIPEAPYGLPAQLSLSLALYVEMYVIGDHELRRENLFSDTDLGPCYVTA